MNGSSNKPAGILHFLCILLFTALCVRSGVMVWRFGQLNQDPDSYRLLAQNFSTHHGFGHVGDDGELRPTAFRPPGYPWLLSWFVTGGQLPSIAVGLLHLGLGLATVWLTFEIGRTLVNAPTGLASGALVAIDPVLLSQSTLVMTETIATFIVAVTWWLLVRNLKRDSPEFQAGRWTGLIVGLVLACGFLVRPIFIVWAALIFTTLILFGVLRQRKLLFHAAAIVLVLSVIVGAWTSRNVSAVGKPVWATSHGGYTLLLGNNPYFYNYLNTGTFGEKWAADSFHHRWAKRGYEDPREETFWQTTEIDQAIDKAAYDEIEDDRLAYETAKASILRQPKMFVHSCFVRVGRLWAVMPHGGDMSDPLRYLIGLYYLTFFGFVILGLWKLGRRILTPQWLIALMLAVSLTSVHAIYWSNMRMRAVAVPMLAVVASFGANRRNS